MEKKKILILSYYWPPAGGPGVQRWLKFSTYLPEFGYEPIIYTPENPSYPILDESLEKEVPSGIRIVRRPILEPYVLAEKLSKSNKKFKGGQFDVGKNQSFFSKLSIWVRGNFFIPDARFLWVGPSTRFLKKFLKEEGIDTIITTGPPHSVHLIGLRLKKHLKHLKWIADFRDPWTEISYHQHLRLSTWAHKKHLRLEREVFERADLTLATSFSDKIAFEKKGAKALTITNGYDKLNVSSEANIDSAQREKFTLLYAGVLEQLRNPHLLWESLSEILKEEPQLKTKLAIRFVGRVDEKIINELKALGLEDHLELPGYLSHSEAQNEIAKSDLLLLTNFPEAKSQGIIPGKLFEYLSAFKPILSFGPSKSDVRQILEETGSGKHFSYEEKKELKDYLKGLLLNHPKELVNSSTNLSEIEKYSRRSLTEVLAKALDKILTEKTA